MPLKTQTQIELRDEYLDICSLQLQNPEVLAYFSDLPSENYISEAIKAFEIGISVISRVQQAQNLDFIEAKFNEIMCRTQEHFHNFDLSMKAILDDNLNPAKAGSFLAQAHQLINSQADMVNANLSQTLRDTRSAISEEAGKIQQSREQLDRKMDPTNNLGYLSAVIQKMEQFDQNLNKQFSPTDSASFVGKLQNIVAEYFGNDGQVLSMIQKQLEVDPTSTAVHTPLNQIYHGLRQEIMELRDTVMKVAGQQEMLQQTSKKGFPFEDQVFEELQRIARPFGEIVEDTSLKAEAITGSKKGDYVYKLANTDASIVLDAKNYGKLKSLPAMIQYLKDAMRDRNAKIGVIVVPNSDSLQKQIGSWNVYGRCIITPLDSLEISIKFARLMIQMNNSDSQSVNIGLVQQKLETIQRKMKEFTSVKTKLTKLSNGVTSSVADIQENLDDLRHAINEKLLEVQSEFKKS